MGWLCQTHHLSLLLLPLLSPLWVYLQGGKFGGALLDGEERWGSVWVANCTQRGAKMPHPPPLVLAQLRVWRGRGRRGRGGNQS